MSPDTLPSGVIVAGASVMNFDRDPADVDLFEYSFPGAMGVTARPVLCVRVMTWMRAHSAQLEPV